VTPYVGQTTILALVTVFFIYIAVRKTQWDFFWVAGLIWSIFASYVYFIAMKYKICWSKHELTMFASGVGTRTIQFSEITEVRRETATPDEFFSQARPFRRIVVVGRTDDPNAYIDISLRHFRTGDINRLVTEIRKNRPDLKIA
jgi:hypothetical protein